jgi:hypothetical protein
VAQDGPRHRLHLRLRPRPVGERQQDDRVVERGDALELGVHGADLARRLDGEVEVDEEGDGDAEEDEQEDDAAVDLQQALHHSSPPPPR